MIPYNREPGQVIPSSSVKIIGLGGAGANILERIALDGMEGAELIALNTDIRTLNSCIAKEKIQLGLSLTKGLGAGGDPELGQQAVLEAESEVRAALKDSRIVFLCTGLGGGTGSGAAPIVTRIAREEGAFVVVFATMPFAFEGRRRREQAETALNQLAVLSNALVTFDNNRMGELVLAKQGIHEAFAAADQMVCESIKAVIRLVVRPGLINVGLDDLMSALRTNRSRCLFGSGIASGKDRASRALRNALASPLLDQGSLLKDARTVLVHLAGGEDLTLFEIELLMQSLQKYVPDSAHVLFGAAVDPSMGDALSLTLISALPEDSLAIAPREEEKREREATILDPSDGYTPVAVAETLPEPEIEVSASEEISAQDLDDVVSPEPGSVQASLPPEPQPLPSTLPPASVLPTAAVSPTLFGSDLPFAEATLSSEQAPMAPAPHVGEPAPMEAEVRSEPTVLPGMPEMPNLSAGFPEPTGAVMPVSPLGVSVAEFVAREHAASPEPPPAPEVEGNQLDLEEPNLDAGGFSPIPRKRPPGVSPWPAKGFRKPEPPESSPAPEPPKLKLGIKSGAPQSELSLDSAPRGRFEGENPNVVDGEDLDLPPFLRKKK